MIDYFHDFNDPYNQLSLIESENIDEYNIKFGIDIPYINFRRNIVTKGIKLNDLIGKKLKVGSVELEGIELCRPCRHLTEMLDQKNILKEFMRKGGLRCQILSSSKINIGDKIEIICDGGIRRGTHVLKALSLGAKACSGGRFYLYALAAAGQKGVEKH